MKISQIKIHGIKSYTDSSVDMSNYAVFVGENNSGKSNILFALLWFFGKEKLALNDVNSGISDDPYIEIEFELQKDEEFTHPDEYLVDGKFKVRAILSRSKISDKALACEYHGYTGSADEDIKDTKLLGWKTVAKPSFGDVIYMPSVRPLSEELKFTANSSLNQLVTKNIIARIKAEDEKNQHYGRVVESISALSNFISEGEGSAIQKLKEDISKKMLDYGNVQIGFDLVPPDAEDLIKSCFRPHTSVEGISDKLPLTSQGDGFQRSMMFSLIANLAELNKGDQKTGKKLAKNECNTTKLAVRDVAVEAEKIAKSDHLRYLLWIDPTRANAFLSQKVILVEGSTEKAMFSFLFNNPKGAFYDESGTAKITVIDTVGKYHFYKFAKLLNKFGIKVWCIYDGDNDACRGSISHKLLNENIEKLKTDSLIKDCLRIDPDIETSLGLIKGECIDVEFYVDLEENKNKCVESEGYLKVVNFIKEVIAA